MPSCWDEKNISKACSTGKEHQESGVRECSYLQSGIRPLSGVECTLQNPSHIFGGEGGYPRFLKPRDTSI